MNSQFPYPPTPQNVPASITQASASFKNGVKGAMASIISFFIVYLLLFVAAIFLVIGCFYAGLKLITLASHLMIIAAGIGVMGVGVMVFIFLIKFVFAVTTYDRSGIVEIKEEEQPVLFSFIRQLTSDTQTPFPHKIYLSADVNACVFYDSSFWSMFLPVKKNLQIGLGLVNAVNLSEFKAVMAHEFGHFSQRSMKLGSFVYQVNKIIHNMLFENKGYGDFLSSWGSIHGIFAVFATITAKIANTIQWVLRQMYAVVNKSYMRLSREMEFHADAMAASVSGSKSLITALHRIDFANTGYNIAIQKCNDFFRQKEKSGNIFRNQTAVIKRLAIDYKLPLQNSLPVVSESFLKSQQLSRINFKDQWASHPTNEDREKHLNELAVVAIENDEPAWVLFQNIDVIQASLTHKIYEKAEAVGDASFFTEKDFEDKLYNDFTLYAFNEQYNNFYDNREITIPDDMDFLNLPTSNKTFAEIFTQHNGMLYKKIQATASDIEMLNAITAKNIPAKTFDFDGIKKNREDARELAVQLEQEKKQLEEELVALDRTSIEFFFTKENGAGVTGTLVEMYKQYSGLRKKAADYLQRMNSMLELLSPIYSGVTISVQEINNMIAGLKKHHEPAFKEGLQYWHSLNTFDSDPLLKKRITDFIATDYVYFDGNSFFDRELLEMQHLCNDSWILVHSYNFRLFKKITELQLQYEINNSNPVPIVLSIP